MFQHSTKSTWLFITGITIGGIGAIGQAYLLYHELVHNYPYKVLDYSFYKGIADVGVYLAPAIAIICGLLFGLKRWSFTTIIPVMSCPLLFAVTFKTITVIRAWNGIVASEWSFEGTTPAIAAQDFFLYSISLAIAGLVIGVICSLLLVWLSKSKKLA